MKKKLNIALLLLVFGLWGTVIYKYVSQYFTKSDINNSNRDELISTDLKLKEKDTFQISPLNRDPFLNKTFTPPVIRPIVFRQHKLQVEPKKTVQPTIAIPFPIISYLGYIKSKEKQYEIALLKVNGKFLKLKINETKDNLKLVSISKDSIKIKFDKQEKSFSLKK